MKKIFEFMLSNYFDILLFLGGLCLFGGFILPMIYGLSKELWRWALYGGI